MRSRDGERRAKSRRNQEDLGNGTGARRRMGNGMRTALEVRFGQVR